ncbi:MAG: hypothetical protein K0R93_1044 [Anaerosolibacter sp.]|jgi:hypothetical protein|uniref:phage tail assembly chaperone n=1 Tax=Anaerosolibacter sp. TaxID=1872527 RepID=UPI002625264C|nr:phage portal protein [Anaerosolibacter sp.]MDF2546146.1 hypothetical protein [Anaerosolibacter sp.]
MKIDTKQTKQTPKRVTLDELIKRALNKGNEPATKQLYVQSLEGVIVIEKPSKDLCLDALSEDDEGAADRHLVYNCVIEPNLKNPDLIKAYGLDRPIEIVDKIFEPGEVAAISKECLAFAGYIDSVKVVEDIKN